MPGSERAKSAPIASSVMPAETIATTSPDGSTTGPVARTDGPSVPVNVSVNVRPASAGSIVPMKRPPICAGFGCVKRVRSGAMTVMKEVPVASRTCSTYGCSASVGRGPVTAPSTSGERVSAATSAVTSTSASRSAVREALTYAAAVAAATTTARTSACSSRSCRARLGVDDRRRSERLAGTSGRRSVS